MKTVKTNIEHTGALTLAVPVHGGTLTVRPGAKMNGVEILPIDDDRRALYLDKGLTFSAKDIRGAGSEKKSSGKPNLAELEKAVTDAKAEHASALAASEATDAGDDEQAALRAAVDAVDEAETALAAAKK